MIKKIITLSLVASISPVIAMNPNSWETYRAYQHGMGNPIPLNHVPSVNERIRAEQSFRFTTPNSYAPSSMDTFRAQAFAGQRIDLISYEAALRYNRQGGDEAHIQQALALAKAHNNSIR